MTESTDLNKGDFYPIVGLYVQHLDPVSRNWESTIILWDAPGDVDLVSDAIFVLWSTSKIKYHAILYMECCIS